MTIDWMKLAQALQSEMVERRRDLHRHPELAFEEFRTAQMVAGALAELGCEVQTGVGKTGVVGILEGKREGPTVLVRADMDALPVLEATQAEYASETPGKMHACGHDGHTTIALAVAKMLSANRDSLAGRVKFVFQPAEEIGQGAMAMINDGVLNSPRPDVCLGLHLRNDAPVGEVSVTDGPAMAASSTVQIAIKGKGGHGAMPEQTRDPLMTGVQIVNALQTVISRNISGMDTAVLSICKFNAGHAINVVPDEAHLGGTFRTFRKETHALVERRIEEISRNIAAAMGCTVETRFDELTPPLVNDSMTNARLRTAFAQLNSPLNFSDSVRWMASEDMACFLERIPGTYFFVGSADSSRGLDAAHHHPRFDFDERVLSVGAGLLAAAVAAYVVPA